MSEIVLKPALKSSLLSTATHKPSLNKVSFAKRSVIVEKVKVYPRDSKIERVKLKNTAACNLTNIAINTLATGALKCDNTCVTSIRKRGAQCSCNKPGKSTKVTPKQVQTHNKHNFLDKSCGPYVKTFNCGTQYWTKHGIGTVGVSCKLSHIRIRRSGTSRNGKTGAERDVNMNTGVRRWAVSQYGPVKGPDF